MPLTSKHFKGDEKLENTLVDHRHHLVPGARGAYVNKIQKALVTLGAGVIDAGEIKGMLYGPTTARTVLAYKGPPRNIVNKTYQNTPDNIVGIMTMKRLDLDMYDFENRPPQPLPFSLYVALTPHGDIHDHTKCPIAPGTNPGKVQVDHAATPIYPKGTGRKVNIGGEHETDYLGFSDYLVYTPTRQYFGYMRPFTATIRSHTASDICMRASPLYPEIEAEIKRIAAPACRFTYAGPNLGYVATARSMGHLIESHPSTNPTGLPIVVVEIQ